MRISDWSSDVCSSDLLERTDGQPGDDVVLTIDAELQRYAIDRLSGESAAAVVMDIHTGEILSLVSNPGFDPNWFNVGITQAQWKLLSTDKYKPLTNKAIQGQYPPGSTFKMMVGMAALASGAIDANTRENGRASVRERVCHYVENSGVAVTLKK